MKYLLILLTAHFLFIEQAHAAIALCKSSATSTSYCKYVGKVEQIYINNDGLVLIFLEKEIPIDMAMKFNYKISSGKAIALEITPDNSYLTSLIYHTAMEALTENIEVEIHARSTVKGYMKLDRIWLNSPNNFF
ncbi:hypothetical protein [Thalassotalea sp. SU-HH00458]|uniref:hypothetical protein n=1 Tax=Thalassotalea sp. SU-HH00458 TaxID=3127657 RepID=UPI003103EB5B